MRRCCIAAFVFVCVSVATGAEEEFAGPFASWKNVRTDYGAVGDGKADDSDAVQKALDDIQKHQAACVLYFPAGTYRITKTVHTARKAHTDCMGVAIVGQDPATTTIRWDGPDGGMMVKYDAWYSAIRRLTLDGAGKAGIALAYGDAFSTYNETADMVFQDVRDGMSMATGGNGQAENEVLRCTFRRCSGAGLRTNNYNSMDIWAWYCRFEDCAYGLYNGAGNFHAFQCLFLRSTKMDIGSANLMVFSFINNTSIGSKCFMDWAGGHSWGSPTSITGNRIVEPTGEFAIRLGNGGPYVLMDNAIRSRAGVTAPAVHMTWGDQALVGNTYTVADAVKKAGRSRIVDDKVVAPSAIDATEPKMPATPPRRDRRIFDVVAPAPAAAAGGQTGAATAAIQAAVDQAATLAGQRPIVHLPMGVYKIDRTVTVPAGCDVQIVGDGAAETATVLKWTGKDAGPVFRLAGPSRATIRDLGIYPGAATGVLVEGADQPGGRVFADQLNAGGGTAEKPSAYGVLADGIEQSDVLLRCLQGGSDCGKWVEVTGGPARQAGKDAPGQVSVLAGATGTAQAQYSVGKGGRLVVRSVYHEMSSQAPQGIGLSDCGVLAIDATRFSYKTSPTRPLVLLDGFRGEFALLTALLMPVNSTHTARIQITGDGARCNALCMADQFWINEPGVDADKVWLADAKPAPAGAAMLLCNMNSNTKGALPKGGFGVLEPRGAADDEFLRRMLAPIRQCRVWLPAEAAAGKTDLALHRVIVGTGPGGTGLELRGR
jgi:ferredoxin-like protein FixX